jgi:acyl-CoA-binding protein
MEGDVDGVMERPMSVGSGEEDADEAKRDRDKYDAWDAQRGISRTEAKRRYIEALIETMHKYASTTA